MVKSSTKPVRVKQTGKVIGMIITECPMCNNTISFDVQKLKNCPYCNAEVSVELDRIEVIVTGSRPQIKKVA